VRFVSNHSSGRMGVSVAAAAWRRGASVTLIAGPLAVPIPVGVSVVRVESTDEMRQAVERELGQADVLVMAAAPADYRPAKAATSKLKKTGQARAIELEENADILKSTRNARHDGAVVVGFALETDDLIENAKRKLDAKALDLIVLNDAKEEGAGFGVETNRVTLLARGTPEPQQLPLLTKPQVADVILDRVEALLRGR
jgi:phosphopantothenoylcysteine decarboxylase/phosphopantothenate--cysteine ligase